MIHCKTSQAFLFAVTNEILDIKSHDVELVSFWAPLEQARRQVKHRLLNVGFEKASARSCCGRRLFAIDSLNLRWAVRYPFRREPEVD